MNLLTVCFQRSQTKQDRQHQKQLLGKLSADLDYLEVLASEIRYGHMDNIFPDIF